MPRDQRLPLSVIRDLLGITRALYRAELEAAPRDRRTLEALEQIGQELKLALDMGKHQPGSMAAVAAWNWAEQATFKLGEIVRDMPIAPAVKASVARMKR
jgi:hypothetical protein